MPSDDENPLTRIGVLQMQHVADFLVQSVGAVSRPTIQLVSSPMLRAMQSSHIVATRLGIVSEIEPALRERNFGVLDGVSMGECQRQQMLAHRSPDRCVAGESIKEHRFRAWSWFEHKVLASQQVDWFVIVAHGGTIEQLQMSLIGAPVQRSASVFFACEPAAFHEWTLLKQPIEGWILRADAVNRRVYVE